MSDAFAADQTRVAHVIVLSVFCFLALVAVIFRLWARRVQRARWALNDYLCVVGLVFALALSLFTIHSQVYWDLGGDPTQKGNPQAILALVILQAMLVGEILWVTAVFFVRASVLQLYIHLFYSTKPFRLTCYVVHAVNFGYASATVMAACLVCRPIAYAWDPTIPGGSCGDQKSLDLFIGVFNLLMDVAVVILPMPVLWGLQMGVQKKIVLSAIFGMGIVICIITLVRIWVTSLIQGDSNAQKIYSNIALLTCLEASLGVINACLPVMKPVFTKFGDSKIYSFFSNSFPSASSSSSPSKPSKSSSASGQSNSKCETPSSSSSVPQKSIWRFHTNKNAANAAAARVFGRRTNKEMQTWPTDAVNGRKTSNTTTTATTTSPPSPESNMHRFVGDKAAQIMFSHTSTSTSTASGPTCKAASTPKPKSTPKTMMTVDHHIHEKHLPPRPPPKSKYYRPERKRVDMLGGGGRGAGEKELEIVVRREWDVDVERGDLDSRDGDGVRGSDDMGRELLRDGGAGRGYGRPW